MKKNKEVIILYGGRSNIFICPPSILHRGRSNLSFEKESIFDSTTSDIVHWWKEISRGLRLSPLCSRS